MKSVLHNKQPFERSPLKTVKQGDLVEFRYDRVPGQEGPDNITVLLVGSNQSTMVVYAAGNNNRDRIGNTSFGNIDQLIERHPTKVFRFDDTLIISNMTNNGVYLNSFECADFKSHRPQVVIVTDDIDDWQQLKIDGAVVLENHLLRPLQILKALHDKQIISLSLSNP